MDPPTNVARRCECDISITAIWNRQQPNFLLSLLVVAIKLPLACERGRDGNGQGTQAEDQGSQENSDPKEINLEEKGNAKEIDAYRRSSRAARGSAEAKTAG